MIKRIICVIIFYLAVTVNVLGSDQKEILIENKAYINKYAKLLISLPDYWQVLFTPSIS